MKNFIKQNQNGITLIALVITIIVLLILAGVSISMLTGEKGILTQAEQAKKENEKTSVIEQAEIDVLAWRAEKLGKNEDATLSEELIKEILTGKDYLKDGTLEAEGFKNKNGEIIFEYSDIYDTDTFDAETFELGEPVEETIDKYGCKVNGYNVTTEEFTTGIWRLFYQDSNYTYLITDECLGEYKPSEYYTTETNRNGELKYQTGADVSEVGRKLNKMLLDKGTFFVETNTKDNIRATAWLTDTKATIWKQYKNKDAAFAIGAPTIELYKASYDATASKNNASTFTIGVGTHGYYEETVMNQIKNTYSYGIYNKNFKNCWIASPDYYYVTCTIGLNGGDCKLNFPNVNREMYAVRPIVCIPTAIFNTNYASTLVAE